MGKVAVVTGGSSGIGRSIAKKLSECGAEIAVVDLAIPEEKLAGVSYYVCDVASGKSVQETAHQILEAFGSIDILVNNAGINKPRLLVDLYGKTEEFVLSEEDFDQMINVNQKGVYLFSQAAAKVMLPKKAGVIINISSEAGMEGSVGQSCYAATKGAVNAFTRSWAKELGAWNIRVVGVAPGINEKTGITSPKHYEALAYTRNIPVENVDTGYEKSIPLGRAGHLDEIGDLVAYLSSDLASYITGTTINITGGKSRG
ncbi:sorbitol-6-phosphate dehydrogenase subunit [Candidatus Enterococcus ferrettii]|uniref:Sorbitol-6-phosphate 2-dehydrogenase n=1 Tax=Candidatus Enterococcus ferrettii TaxID=2815324 RepID=A0ABV0EX64_9ENTE|nr:sorbitol-6-phosphate dehydrogenase subunit [Enterococcus sp. 665A]MBO1339490.1 SDR family oxidoreductase [Enterococcus sp. 665A]